MESLLFAFWFFLPAGLANITPIILNKISPINRWNTPMDFGRTFKGKRIFGENKKLRGLIIGTAVGALSATAVHGFTEVPAVANPLIVGGLLGFGAIAGDAVESFFKRQIGKKPGESWFPFDQIDYIAGGLLASSVVVDLKHWWQAGSIIIVYFGLHLVSTYIGYLLKLKDKPI